MTLAMQVYSAVAVRMACKRRSILKMRFSPRPTSTSARGLNRSTWRQISEPMLPPAPVTITVRPFQELADHLGVQLDGGAAQQVADFDVADGNAMVAAEAVFQAADDLQVQPRLLAVVHQRSAAASRAGCRQSPGRRSPWRRRRFPARPPASPARGSGPAAISPSSFRAEEAADAIGQLAVGLDLVGQHAVGMIGADQQGPAGVALVEHRPELFPVHPPASPQRPQQRRSCSRSRGWELRDREGSRTPGRRTDMAPQK